MAENDLNQKYTLTKYCSKMEVAKALGTNLIEPFWKEIYEFRKRLSIDLTIFDSSHTKFSLTYFDRVQSSSSRINNHLSSYITSYAKIKKGTIADYTFTRDMLKISLKNIAKINKIDASEIILTNILDEKETDEKYFHLMNYKRALFEFSNFSFGAVDEEFLAREYAILRGEEELTSFYRESDVTTASSMALVDRDYDQGVPTHLIDDMMASLFECINNKNVALATRLCAIFFMFNYVKPFEKFNLELACLLAKRVIGAADANVSCIFLPIESLLTDDAFFGEISKEVKKTHDFTYAFLEGSNVISDAFEIAISRIDQVHARSLEVETSLGTDPKKIKEEFGVELEQNPKPTFINETKSQIQTRLEKPLEKTTNSTPEKELKARMNDLLEQDPFLKKSQAHFYVHHCTIGRYYSIQQFTKFENCVYETGRTSMDNLAKLGYYRKEQIKNKFVYTPIEKE